MSSLSGKLLAEFSNRQRQDPSYSLRQFARELGLSPAFLSKLLKDERGLSRARAKEIATTLGYDGAELELFVRFATSAKRETDRRFSIIEGASGPLSSVFRLLLQNHPVIYCRMDRRGIFEVSIGGGLKLIGLEDNQVVGMNALELYPSSRDKLLRALAGEEVRFLSYGTYEGKPWCFESHAFPAGGRKGGIVCLFLYVPPQEFGKLITPEALKKGERRKLSAVGEVSGRAGKRSVKRGKPESQ